MRTLGKFLLADLLAGSAIASQAVAPGIAVTATGAMAVPVSGGCAPNDWHGPWDHCPNTSCRGRLPDERWQQA